MAETIPTPAEDVTDEHIGAHLLIGTPWGDQVGEITAVSNQRGFIHLTVLIKAYADKGPLPIAVHRRAGDVLQLVPDGIMGPVSPTVAGR